jgi:hypothetical protein
VNGGYCNAKSGICSCPSGFTGPTCAKVVGCNPGGEYSCLNGGYCNYQTSTCVCPLGLTGITCSTSKLVIIFMVKILNSF